MLAGSNVNLAQAVPHHLLHKSATVAQPFNSTGAALQQLHQQQLQQRQQQHQQPMHSHQMPQPLPQQFAPQPPCQAHPHGNNLYRPQPPPMGRAPMAAPLPEQQQQRTPFSRHLPANLEAESPSPSYYTEASQQSPLIQ